MIREFFLQQNAYHPVDTYTPLSRQYAYMSAIRKFSSLAKKALTLEVPLERVIQLPSRTDLGKLKFEETIDKDLKAISLAMEKQFASLGV
jgi:V/A-type H+-transporting ATPase subunit A